jgi:hypothetical protein
VYRLVYIRRCLEAETYANTSCLVLLLLFAWPLVLWLVHDCGDVLGLVAVCGPDHQGVDILQQQHVYGGASAADQTQCQGPSRMH